MNCFRDKSISRLCPVLGFGVWWLFLLVLAAPFKAFAGDDSRPSARSHWSFTGPVRPVIPDRDLPVGSSNPIDAFVAAERRARGLTAVPAAERHLLLRRLYFDLIGLPPTPEQLNEFLADESPDAYESAVDRLLNSPQYGVRWGRHWMDVWRYSDWAGYGMEIRQSQRHIWRWRDWIIDSLNRDKPYDAMLMEMLAGDEIAPLDPDTLRATGFVARNWFKFNRNVWLDSIVEHTSKAFLGLTINCARCHEHKFDPIEQEDYYRFRAFFEPHNVRTDRVPGQPDAMQDGLPRVFDFEIDAPTYLFVRGDEGQPFKDKPLKPGVPAFLHAETNPVPVELPNTAYYPGLRRFVQQESIESSQSAMIRARDLLDQANRQVDVAKQECVRVADGENRETDGGGQSAAIADAESAVARAKEAARLAQLQFTAAKAQLESVRARIAADSARFALPAEPAAAELARTAAQLERAANTAEAERLVLAAEQQHQKALQSPMPESAKAKEAIAAAEKGLNESRDKLKAAQASLSDPSSNYTLFSELYPTRSSGRRLALAKWIADRQNPLTARVAVNHIWMRHFGRPLVTSTFDFGLNGQKPTHPELLDWLAVEFMDHGWSMKWLHRLIVTSETYRLASSVPDEIGLAGRDSPTAAAFAANGAADPDNRYLWRQNVRRLEAEIVRDSVLQVAGQLDLTLGGPDLEPGLGMTSNRRSIYFRTAAEKQMTFLALFDQASVAECYRRGESVVPQQALALANSPLALEQSRTLAKILMLSSVRESSESADTSFVVAAFQTILGRSPDSAEETECIEFLQRQANLLRDPAQLKQVSAGTAASIKPAGDALQRARENLIHVLMNHNEFVTIR